MRICPICHKEMHEDAYLINKANFLNDLYIVRRDENFVKHEAPVEAAVCPHCGHIELFYNSIKYHLNETDK
ncbi:hypothetical protein FYJ79_07345 [Sharpea azabuensis]|jgi:hypothetical protein|uniref:Nucleic acid-binding protein n=1 Tax=Sharpea porci TaxID=2652286 RepID=A0A844FUJ9_9FIRM|nr:hypothetical protein [Sharpea porci]MDD6712130.1 hypothetical protein [Sharpea porci]MDY5278003.1 hypothetical protein [Sharpea porci]MST89384.1 hypothetical protein [Sharpea porci]